MEQPVVIDVKGLTKRFGGRTVVDDLSLKVRQGEIYGFLGPNGSGKTTTIRMICGLLKPNQGNGVCLGFDISGQSDLIKRQVGYMAQHFSLYQDLTVQENMDFIARLYGVPAHKKAVAKSLERMGLEPYKGFLAGQLSGGWKQRLALACCTIHNPRLLLLDEPTAGVDPKARREFWDHIHELSATGITSLISTHYMDEAERCHSLAYIAYGRLMTKGTVEQVVEREGLTTWSVTGGDLFALEKQVKSLPGVEQAVAFGNTLHVIGKQADLLKQSLTPLMKPPYHWQQAPTSLEEVFISLMSRAEKN